MRAVIQRVSSASVKVDGKTVGEIQQGLAVLLGVMEGDGEAEAAYLAKKLTELRIFTDENDKMNLSVQDIDGGILILSQFTLGADCSHGRRPSFTRAARPETAEALYLRFIREVRDRFPGPVETGVFGADMKFSLVNDGPVTILFDTDEMRSGSSAPHTPNSAIV